MTLTVGSLFSGIGGLDVGLARAGMTIEWQCELDPFRRSVLARRFPLNELHDDITTLDPATLRPVHLICGGFPCEDISRAGRRAGIDGAKSGLWSHMHRVVRYLLPDYILVENSTSLLVRGLDRVLADLAEIGYDAEWDCLPAAAFGAPHIRDRLYLLAYPRQRRHGAPEGTVFAGWASSQLHGGWTAQPRVGRVADGVPDRVDRLAALGDAIVPQAAEWVGRRIMARPLAPPAPAPAARQPRRLIAPIPQPVQWGHPSRLNVGRSTRNAPAAADAKSPRDST